MLLQLVYDDMLHWKFGDMRAFQFWIHPDDLARANWAAVRLTFDGHLVMCQRLSKPSRGISQMIFEVEM